jgi:hypothetical protein
MNVTAPSEPGRRTVLAGLAAVALLPGRRRQTVTVTAGTADGEGAAMPVLTCSWSHFNPPPGSTVATGADLISPFAGSPQSVLNLGTNVGPNALLKSASYPVPSDTGHGPLTAVPLPSGHGWWSPDDGSGGGFNWPSYWGTPTQAYAYDDSPSNLGGIVGAGGMSIDGFTYPAGTYVFQFMDFSAGGMAPAATSPSLLFRGCRMRGQASDIGWSNSYGAYASGWRGSLAWHYCEFGQRGSADAQGGEFQLDCNGEGNVRLYRCYCSYYADGMFPNGSAGYVDFIENMLEKPVYFYGDAGPSGTGDNFHMCGTGLNGGETHARFLRNSIVWPAVDEAGHTLGGTAPFELTQDAGQFIGSGTNPDGSTGFVVSGNYCGGGNFPFYLGQRSTDPANSVQHLHFTGNLVTTSTVAGGGLLGLVATVPPWGDANGNDQSGNVWADGPSAGLPFM